jgi:hypothetical protein
MEKKKKEENPPVWVVSWSVGWGHTSTFIRSLFSSSGIYG